jgi:hypothetical protein
LPDPRVHVQQDGYAADVARHDLVHLASASFSHACTVSARQRHINSTAKTQETYGQKHNDTNANGTNGNRENAKEGKREILPAE